MLALALLLATAAPAHLQTVPVHSVHVARHRRADRRTRSVKPPLLMNVMASCAVNPARIGCNKDSAQRYRLTETGDGGRYDGKTASIEVAEKRNTCGVVGMPVCPRKRRPWVRIALDRDPSE